MFDCLFICVCVCTSILRAFVLPGAQLASPRSVLLLRASEYGIDINGEVTVDFGKVSMHVHLGVDCSRICLLAALIYFSQVMARMRKIRAEISDMDAAERLTRQGIDLFLGRAVFDSPTSVIVNDRRLVFRKVGEELL